MKTLEDLSREELVVELSRLYRENAELAAELMQLRWVTQKGRTSDLPDCEATNLQGLLNGEPTQSPQAHEGGHPRRSFQLFETLFESSSEAIAISDPHGRIFYVNPAHERLFGRSIEEARRLNYSDYYSKEAIEILQREVVPALARGESWEGVIDAFDASGRRFPLWERVDTIQDADGRMLYGFGIMHDVSVHKAMEETLRENSERYTAIFDQSPIAIEFYGPDGKLEMVNDACCKMFGIVDRSEILGFSLFDDPNVSDSVKSLIQDGKTVRYEANFDFEKVKDVGLYQTTKSGVCVFDILISPIRDASRIIAYIAQVQDVTLRKQAEEALRESEARWQFALEGPGDGVWDWDVTTNEVFFSRQWKAMLGYEEHEIGNTLDEWDKRVHPEDKERCYADLQRHIQGEVPVYNNEHRVLCKDGTYKWVLDRGKVIQRLAGGKPKRMIGTHADITARKSAEKALRESQATLQGFYDSSPFMMGVSELDGDRVIAISGNAAVAAFLGTTPGEIPNRTGLDLCKSAEVDQLWIEQYKRCKEEGTPVRFQFDPVISARWLDATIAFIGDGSSGAHRFSFIVEDITERKQMEDELVRSREELERRVYERTKSLEEANAALRFLLKQREADKEESRRAVLKNVRHSIQPFLEKLTACKLPAEAVVYLNIVESKINDIAASFVLRLSDEFLGLTSMEIRVAEMIRDGRNTKEIATLLYLSPGTIRFHRENLREKLGIKGKSTNLASFLKNADK